MTAVRHASPPSVEAVAQHLREAGLRVTRPRLLVYETLLRDGGHLVVEALNALLRARGERVAVASTYAALRALMSVGAVRLGAVVPGAPLTYEVRADNHHHLLCRSCGRVDDAICATGDAPCLEPADPRGFALDRAEVTYVGLCAECAALQGAGR